MTTRPNGGASATPGKALILGVAAASAVAGFVAVYVTAGRPDNAAREVASAVVGPFQAQPAQAQSAVNPLSTGQMTAFVFKKTPEVLPDLAFVDGEGKPRTLADWKGKVVLLNFWATWCAPCRKEMPALDRLQKELGSDAFEVVALSVDRGGIAASKKFLDQIKTESLRLYVDPTGKAGSVFRVIGMPTTLLIGKDGREIGRLIGPAEWDAEEAKRLIRASL